MKHLNFSFTAASRTDKMQKGAKKREVIFAVESVEHFHEKISAENKKLICK